MFAGRSELLRATETSGAMFFVSDELDCASLHISKSV
jgi:hypothetical protein